MRLISCKTSFVGGTLLALLFTMTLGATSTQVRALRAARRTVGPGARVMALDHVGSFKVPDGAFGGPQYHGFNWGGTALGFNGVQNSLFIVGHDQDQLLAEISIPDFGGTATVLQNFADPTGGRIKSINPGDPNGKKIGGTLPWGSTLLVSAYSYYDGAGTQVLSHFVRPTTLAEDGVTGPLRVGPLGAGFYSGYMAVVPAEWHGRLGGPALTGNAALGVISRTSYGPAASAFDPDHLSPSGAQPLVYYPGIHQTLGGWNGVTEFFGGSDTIRGIAIVPDTSTLLFFGRHGTTFCYGAGTTDQSLDGQPTGNGVHYCYDPSDGSKGVHGYPYLAYAWAYDLQDLAAVHVGHIRPWDVKPYAVLRLPGMGPQVGGATIDPATGQIYVSEMFGNGTLPVIHVFAVQ